MRKKIAFALSVAAAAAILAWVLGGINDPGALRSAFETAAGRPGWLVLGIAAFGISMLCGVLRWRVILKALELPIGMTRAVRLYAIGHFFNVLVPGATGGDVVKAAVAAADCPGKRPEAVASIAAERYIGMVAIFLIVGTVSLLRPGFFGESPELRLTRYAAMAAGAAAIIGTLLLFGFDWTKLIRDSESIRSGFLRKAADVALRMYSSVRLCSHHPFAASVSLILSLLNHVVCVAVAFCMGEAIGIHVSFADYLTVIPLVNTVVALPITPGGVGVREAATCALMARAGLEPAGAAVLSLLYNGAVFVWAFAGGAVYALMGVKVPVSGEKRDE